MRSSDPKISTVFGARFVLIEDFEWYILVILTLKLV